MRQEPRRPQNASATPSAAVRSGSRARTRSMSPCPSGRRCSRRMAPVPRPCCVGRMRLCTRRRTPVATPGDSPPQPPRRPPRTRVPLMAVTKAVIPAAGLGTRFLPATKATPKEMLPVVDKPAIQYVVEEAARAGLDDVLLVTGRNKKPLEDHFDRAFEREQTLAAKGDEDKLAVVQHASAIATIHYVRQGDPKGLGHAVLAAARHVGDEAFAVLLGDDLIDARDPLLETMVALQERAGGSVVALMEVPKESISLYGCAAVTPGDGDEVRITALVEKP